MLLELKNLAHIFQIGDFIHAYFKVLFSPFRPIIVQSQQDTQYKNLKSAIKDTSAKI